MTGKSILEALSFVDERYIEEAENGKLRSRDPLRYLLPLAACFCVILVGFRFMHQPPEAAEPQDTLVFQESANVSDPEMAETPKENDIAAESDIALDAPGSPGVSEIPSVILIIEEWTGDGFSAVVAGTVDTDIIAMGREVQVEFLPNIVIEKVEDDLVFSERRIPAEADFPVGTTVRVMFRSYSEEESILRIETIRKEECP